MCLLAISSWRLLSWISRNRRDVLERDRGLVAEGLQQRDFLVGERPHFLPAQQDRAERLSLAIERHRRPRVRWPNCACELVAQRVFGALGQHVAHLDRRPSSSARPEIESRLIGSVSTCGHRIRRGPLRREMAQRCRRRSGTSTRPRRRRGAPRARRSRRAPAAVGRRARDHAQDFADRRLLVERLLGLVEQAHVVDRDRRLARERFHQRDLVGRKLAAPRGATAGSRRRRRRSRISGTARMARNPKRCWIGLGVRDIRVSSRGTMSA